MSIIQDLPTFDEISAGLGAIAYSPGVESPRIRGIVFDSRQVQPGDCFVALSGGNVDGHRYIPDAVQRGAAAVVGVQPLQGLRVPYLRVFDSRLALALLSAAFYRFPARQLTVIGITGTDGKTTTTNLLYQILRTAGIKVGMISTVNAVIGDRILDTGFHVTTPEAPDVQRYLAQMVAAGLDTVILEATSHGLDQQRVAACEFDIGVITNITHEHLDYHGSLEAYRSAKARLFTSLSETSPKTAHPPRGAVLNRDDQSYDYLSGLTRVRQYSYGLDEKAAIRAVDIAYQPDGLSFTATGTSTNGTRFQFPVHSFLVGEYNVSNCLAAISVAAAVLELEPEAVQQGIAALPGVPGRMEVIRLSPVHPDIQDFTALVDFAHTPNALMKSLQAARKLTAGRVIAVFGSAGLRDRAKRRMMAEIAAQFADLSILTAEDPRTESLAAILDEMAAGAVAYQGIEGQTFWRIPDRAQAIRFAVNLAQPGDLVIACGKGHEQSMCFGETEYPWDDRSAMRAALAERYHLPGPEMPYLPAQPV
ncbi:MAG: UDP-N-acetylmuramoyl-L-alanyl-D-glutamate--2,6-diaminopimelate ligase [Anaerolineales bacterium]|nr:UDP-N-acetylmuramoyl-L-alanyl-D-glutamate--2,6-diaminopimelate ligase [Anaerolineales bacterium]